MYEASHIANYMLDRAEQAEKSVTPMKLLKLVYIAYGWSLAVLVGYCLALVWCVVCSWLVVGVWLVGCQGLVRVVWL